MLTATHRLLDPALAPIRRRVLDGQRLSFEDGLALYRTRDIFTVGELANVVRERLHGRRAYYNVNRHINYTNYCVLRCKFCSFYRAYPKDGASAAPGRDAAGAAGAAAGATGGAGGAPGGLGHGDAAPPEGRGPGYEYSLDEIVATAAEAYEHGATEVHIVGGLHPKLPFEFYTGMCRAIRERCPGLHIKAFTAIEIIHFARISRPRRSIEEVLRALREAGLDSLPGGGAEIFDDRVHDEAFRAKVGEQHWFDVHRTAHRLGIPTNATMLYGHIETVEERLRHLMKLREAQDEALRRMDRGPVSGPRGDDPGDGRPGTRADGSSDGSAACFQCCIPLSFIPEGSEFAHLPGPTGLDDLRTLAVCRLMLDNFAHIKAFWIMQSPKLSQVALNWGVDDFDGTVVWYDITRREGRGTNRQELSVEQIRRLIREAGCEPVERDTFYRPVARDGDGRILAPARGGVGTGRRA